MKKIKILFILHAVGGVNVYAQLLLSSIDTKLFDIIIIHGEQDRRAPYLDKFGNEYKHYNIPIFRKINPLKDFSCIFKIKKIIQQEKPNLIHAHSAKAGAISRIASFFQKIPVLYTPHAFSYLSTNNIIKKNLYILIEKILKHSHSIILATSNSEKLRAINDIGYKKEKVIVWENSINPILNLFPQSSSSLPNNYICSIGRPSYQKNIEATVEVFHVVKQKIPDLKFILIEGGNYSPNKKIIETLITQKGLKDSFLIINEIPRNKIFEILHFSKLYISTSRYEGLPYSIIECLALGKSCIVSDCDGNVDLIKDNYNGYIIPSNILIEKMTEKIISLLNDEQKKIKFEQNSLHLFNEKYDINKNINKLNDIYTKFSKK